MDYYYYYHKKKYSAKKKEKKVRFSKKLVFEILKMGDVCPPYQNWLRLRCVEGESKNSMFIVVKHLESISYFSLKV